MNGLNRPRDIEVEVTFLPSEHGGKRIPARSGYRPQFYYGGQDWDAEHFYPDVECVNPGDSVRAYLRFLRPEMHVGVVKPGMAFLLREGQQVVGYGTVLRIIDLDESAAAAKSKFG